MFPREGGAPSLVAVVVAVVPIDEYITGFMHVATIARSGPFRCVDVARPELLEAFHVPTQPRDKKCGEDGT